MDKALLAPGMRVSEERGEYIDNIGIIFLEDSDAFIWQNKGGAKLTSNILVKDIIPSDDTLIITPKGGSFPEFNSKSDLYFKAKRKEMLFKILPGQYRPRPREIKLSFPAKVFYREFRSLPRIPLSSRTEGPFVTMRQLKNDQVRGYCSGKIRDISPGGIGLMAKFKEQHVFEPNKSFSIEKIAHLPLDPIKARVVYNHAINNKRGPSFFVGLELEKNLPDELLKDLFDSIGAN